MTLHWIFSWHFSFQKTANTFGYYQFFVGADDAHCDPASFSGNLLGVRRVSLLIKFDSEKPKTVADASANHRRVFADTTSEHKRVKSAERRSESTDPFFRLITK